MSSVMRDLSVVRAEPYQAYAIANIINDAFWERNQSFLDESIPNSKLHVTEESIKTVIESEDNEFYLLTLNVYILGTVLLEKNVPKMPNTVKISLLAKNSRFTKANLNVGDILIGSLMRLIEELRKSIIIIEVLDAGKDSNKLIQYFGKLGFIPTGKLDFYHNWSCLKSPNVWLTEMARVISYPKY